MDQRDLEKRLLEGLREFYAKQGLEVNEELDFAFMHLAEFLAVMIRK